MQERRYVILCGIIVVIVKRVGGGISNSKIITEEGKYSLDAVQNNPDIEDTLAYKLNNLYRNIYYKSGDKIPFTNIYVGGTLTNSGHDIRFTIPCNFLTDAIPKLNIVTLKVRSNGTYFLNDISNVQISDTYYERLGFTVNAYRENVYAENVNNVPVAVECSYTVDFV